jgi:hypothetical protein
MGLAYLDSSHEFTRIAFHGFRLRQATGFFVKILEAGSQGQLEEEDVEQVGAGDAEEAV